MIVNIDDIIDLGIFLWTGRKKNEIWLVNIKGLFVCTWPGKPTKFIIKIAFNFEWRTLFYMEKQLAQKIVFRFSMKILQDTKEKKLKKILKILKTQLFTRIYYNKIYKLLRD